MMQRTQAWNHATAPLSALAPAGLRGLEVTVASGDAVDARAFRVAERMSSLFEIHLVVASENADIDFEAVAGQPMTFSMRKGVDSLEQRTWTGMCKHIEQVAAEEQGLSTYHLTLVPELWLLSQRRNHRMFQQQSELEIVRKVLSEWGIAAVERLSGVYKKRKYRVQYAESDYAFLCRMLEDAGISFYFEAGERETAMVLDDAPQRNRPRTAIAHRDNPMNTAAEHVTRVRISRQVRPGQYTVRDHDHRRAPGAQLLATAASAGGIESRLERYHYAPGAFLFESERGDAMPAADDRGRYRTDEREAKQLAQRRLAAKRAVAKRVSFETNALDLAPGAVVCFLDHPKSELAPDKPLLVVGSELSGTHDGEWSHACEAVSAEQPYHPPLATPKPKVAGVESATVVGPPGEEIHTDELGRVRVHFHWDRESQMDASSSCWIHVGQPWGGAGFGAMNLPRVGQEVIVDFLGGDPDRPIIVGRVHTALQTTPYKLPENKTQSGWKSNSTNGTGGYNEILFDDAAGSELVRIQAEKDMSQLVKHDEQTAIGNDSAKHVGRDEKHVVGRDRECAIGRDESAVVGRDRTMCIGNDESVQVAASRKLVVGANDAVEIEGDQQVSVGGTRAIDVGKTASETVGLDKNVAIGADYDIVVTGAMSTSVGLMSVEQVGSDKTIVAGSRAEISVGGAKITLDKSGKVSIEGTELSFSASGPITISGTEISLSGREVVIEASGQAEVHGAQVKITGQPIDLN
ncbi:type VI secretion system Vgr family protein [Sorangium sp. So ce1078]|uniref:type VI secretion system Vgr family protein n=1 Tax=Sorangium sp. So ce1078 TaxID=3133329 RepID=UPI003F62F3C6